MANNQEYKINVAIETSKSVSSVKDLKASLKELNSLAVEFGEGTAEFEKVTAAAGDLKDQIEDINQAINAKKGTGFEKFGGELGILGDKLGGLDFKGANESIARIGATVKNISFKDLTGTVKDFGQTMLNLGKALLANPIFLIAAVVIGVGAALFALKDKIKIIGAAFDALGAIIKGVVQFFKDLSDAIGLTTFAAEESAQAQIDAAKASQGAVEERYDAEIALAKASGKNTVEVELQKQSALRETLESQINGLDKLHDLQGKFNDDQQKEYADLQKQIRASNLETQVILAQNEKKMADEREKLAEDRAKKAQKAAEDRAAANKSLTKQIEDQEISLIKNQEEREFAAAVKANERAVKAIEDSKASNAIKNQALIEQQLVFENTIKGINDKFLAERVAAEKKATDDINAYNQQAELTNQQIDNDEAIAKAELKVAQNELDTQAQIELLETRRDIELQNEMLTGEQKKVIRAQYAKDIADLETAEAQRTRDATFNIAKASNDSLIALSDLYFSVKQANTKKGSAEEEKAARQQFKINKALAITSAVISGIQGVVNALSAQSVVPEPFGTVLKVATAVGVGLAAAANVAKIAATQFQGGGGGGAAATPSTPSANAPTGIAAAAGSNPAATPRLNDFSLFGTAGKANNATKAPAVEVKIGVDEVTSTQKRVSDFKTASELK